MLPKEDGIEPLSAFFWSFSSRRFNRLPKDVGIAPVRLFSYNLLQNRSTMSSSANCQDSREPNERRMILLWNWIQIWNCIQISQGADGAKCSRYRSRKLVSIKIQADKFTQVTQCCWYYTAQVVVIQLAAKIGKPNFRKPFWRLSVILDACSGCNKLFNSYRYYRYWRFCSPPRSGIRGPEMPAFPKSLQKARRGTCTSL